MPESTHEQSNDTQENIAARLQDAIKKPEATEAYSIGTLYGQDHPLRRLDLSLGSALGVSLVREDLFPKSVEVTAKYFAPHEYTADGSNSAMIAFNAYDRKPFNDIRESKGSVFLLKQTEGSAGKLPTMPTMEDVTWGDNCAVGAYVSDAGDIQWFQLVHEPAYQTEKTYPTIEKIDLSSHKELQQELDRELETFIASRKGIDQPSEDGAVSTQEPAAETTETNEASELHEKAHSMMTAILGEMQEHATEEAGEITRPSILEDYPLEGTDDPAMSVKIVRDGGNCFIATREQGEPQVGVRREHVGGATNNPNHSDIRTVLQGNTIRETEYVWQGPDAGKYKHTWTLEDNPAQFYAELCKMHDIITADVAEAQAKKGLAGRLGEAVLRLRKRNFRVVR
jgi:hypothetical protein